MGVGRSLLKLTIGTGCAFAGLTCAPILIEAGSVWGPILASFLGNVAISNTANALDGLTAGQDPDKVSLENQDLTKAVGKAIAAVITLEARKHPGKTRQYLEKIAAQAKDNWVKIAQQELTQQRYPDLREAKLDQFLTPEEYQLTQQGNLTDTEWGDIFIRLNMAACKGGGFPIPAEVRQQVAELLHTTFPKALRETLKEDFAKDGKAWAGLTLQLLTGMQAQLRQLQANPGGVNVGEFSQILQQFQEVETQLRGSVTQQQAFFREVSRGIESGFAEVCQRLGVMETTIAELLQTLEERLEELRQEVTEFRQEVRQGLEALHNQPGGRQLSKQEYRNRQNILTQMRTEVESRLTQSIHRAAFVNLGKEQQPQQVQRPWDISVKVGEQRRVQLPPQTTILDVFDNPTISGKFLILGKPGGGKTTTLLELAEALIERAERDSDAPIPVILELSSWQEVTKRKFLSFGEGEKYDPSIKEWVLSQIISKGVSQDIGEQWLREKELVLLLDGLDELQPERQGKCVRAINQFLGSEFSPLHLVVCSRKEEYEVYEEMLQLNGAICLEDLTNEQIRGYFASVNLGEFWESIKGSEKIIDFIRQPLFLAVTSIAYEQIDVEEWRNCNTEEKATDYLLGVYRVKMLTNNKISNIYKGNGPKPGVCQNYLARLIEYSPRELRPGSIPKEISPDCFNDSVLYSTKIRIVYLLFVYLISVPICSLFSQISISIILDQLSDRTNLIVVDYLGYLTFYLTIVIFLAILGFGFFFLAYAASEDELLFVKSVPYKWIRNLIYLIIYLISLPIIIFCGLMALGLLSEILGNLDSHLATHTYDAWRQGEPFKNSFGNSLLLLLLAMWTTSAYIGITDCLSYSGIRPIPKKLNFNVDACIFILLFLVFIVVFSFIIYCLFGWQNPVEIIFQNISVITLFLFIGIGLGISFGFFAENEDILITFNANQSKISLKYINASASISIVVAIILFCIGLFLGFISTFQFGLNVALSNGIIIGMFFGLLAGFSCIQYFSLRLTLWLTGQMPWNITRFLDYCTERLILQRVGNRYRFIHRLVQEHFANLEIQKE